MRRGLLLVGDLLGYALTGLDGECHVSELACYCLRKWELGRRGICTIAAWPCHFSQPQEPPADLDHSALDCLGTSMNATKLAHNSVDAGLVEYGPSLDKHCLGSFSKRLVFLILAQHQHGASVVRFPGGKHSLIANTWGRERKPSCGHHVAAAANSPTREAAKRHNVRIWAAPPWLSLNSTAARPKPIARAM